HVAHRAVEDLERRGAGALLDGLQGIVEDPLGGAPLPAQEEPVDEPADHLAAIDRVRGKTALRRRSFPGHGGFSYFGRFVPYLLRLLLRSRVPAASSAPRITW